MQAEGPCLPQWSLGNVVDLCGQGKEENASRSLPYASVRLPYSILQQVTVFRKFEICK